MFKGGRYTCYELEDFEWNFHIDKIDSGLLLS